LLLEVAESYVVVELRVEPTDLDGICELLQGLSIHLLLKVDASFIDDGGEIRDVKGLEVLFGLGELILLIEDRGFQLLGLLLQVSLLQFVAHFNGLVVGAALDEALGFVVCVLRDLRTNLAELRVGSGSIFVISNLELTVPEYRID